MMNRNESIQRVQELIDIEKLNPVIKNIIEKIYDSECSIMISKDRLYSVHKPTPRDCYIILVANSSRDRMHILWDLFHEYGHHKDERLQRPRTKEQEPIREKFAWTIADEEFLKADGLEVYKENYKAYRESCLSIYEITDYSGLL